MLLDWLQPWRLGKKNSERSCCGEHLRYTKHENKLWSVIFIPRSYTDSLVRLHKYVWIAYNVILIMMDWRLSNMLWVICQCQTVGHQNVDVNGDGKYYIRLGTPDIYRPCYVIGIIAGVLARNMRQEICNRRADLTIVILSHVSYWETPISYNHEINNVQERSGATRWFVCYWRVRLLIAITLSDNEHR